MNKKRLFSAFFLLMFLNSFSQKLEARTIVDDEFSWDLTILRSENYSSNDTISTYWVKGSQLYVTQGNVDGYLVDGLAVRKYRTGQLYQKGRFSKGKKDGEWKTWDIQGKLISIVHWKNGMLHGEELKFSNEGNLLSKKEYKKNELHGVVIDQNDTMYFKRGNLILEEENIEKEDTVKVKEKKRFRWFKKKEKSEGDHDEPTPKKEKKKRIKTEEE